MIRPFKSLRGFLTFSSVFIGCIPLFLGGMFLIGNFSKNIEKEVVEENELYSDFISENIHGLIRHTEQIMTQLAHETGIQILSPEPEISKALKLTIKEHPILSSIKVLDLNMRIRTAEPFQRDLLGMDYSGFPHVRDAHKKTISWSDVYSSHFTERPTISLAVAFETGILVADMDLGFLEAAISKMISPRGLYIIITDVTGTVISHPILGYKEERVNLRNLEVIEWALSGGKGVCSFSLGGIKYLGTIKRLPVTGWVLLVAKSKKEAFQELEIIRHFLFASVLGFGILVGGVVWLLVRRITRPLQVLSLVAREMREGRYMRPDVGPSYLEVEETLKAFDSMATELGARESRLRESEAKYKGLIENAIDPIILLDGEGKILEVNKAFLLRGYSREEVIGAYITDFMAEEQKDLFPKVKERVKAGESVQFEVRAMEKGGQSRWYSVSVRPIYGELSIPIGAQCIARDISELKLTEAALKESEGRYRELFNSVRDLIYTHDMEGRVLSLNRPVIELTGYTPEELIGKKFPDLMKPHLREAFVKEYLFSLRKNKESKGISAFYKKNGEKVYVEYKSRLVEPQSGAPFVTGIARDITERIQAERNLRQSELKFRSIFDTAPVPIVLYDDKGKVQAVNRAFTDKFGWTQEEAEGRKVPMVPEEERAMVLASLQRAIAEKGIRGYEGHRITKDGRVLDVVMEGGVLFGEKGEYQGVVVAFNDITEQKRFQRTLQHAQRMEAIGTLAGGIAHNFNNLLAGIQGNVQLLRLQMEKDDSAQKRLRTVEALVQEGATLTRQLLSLAKGGKFEPRPTDLNELIREHNRVFGYSRKDVKIEAELQEGLWPVMCDQNQIKQVLMNLYVNAVQAMDEEQERNGIPPRGGAITIRTENIRLMDGELGGFQEEGGQFVKISVTDTGKGIEDSIKDRIFDPFFTTKEMGRGTGLGLATVYGIVKNHKGYINVESELGKGSTFYIYLPAQEARLPDETMGEGPKEQGVSLEGLVLVVDDDEVVLEVAKEMLQTMGLKVLTSKGAKEAISLFKESSKEIDLVILDMVMPEMSGIELLKKIREMDPMVKVLISSGYNVDVKGLELVDQGVEGVIQKPYTLGELGNRIRDALKMPTRA